MKPILRLWGIFTLAALAAAAQTTSRRPSVRATGNAQVSVTPDLARVSVSVVSQAATAQDAAAQNAAQVSNVLGQLRTVIGGTGDLRTTGYSLVANYLYPKDGGPPTLTGYTATNTVEASTSVLSLIGKVIDAATQAGANRVQGLQFGLKNDSAARAQALREAAQKAKAHAEAMAAGLQIRLGAVIAADEGGSVQVLGGDTRLAATPTPVEPGLVTVSATVTVEIEIAS